MAGLLKKFFGSQSKGEAFVRACEQTYYLELKKRELQIIGELGEKGWPIAQNEELSKLFADLVLVRDSIKKHEKTLVDSIRQSKKASKDRGHISDEVKNEVLKDKENWEFIHDTDYGWPGRAILKQWGPEKIKLSRYKLKKIVK